MVNQVDGLGRFSPDLHSTNSTCSTGYGTPEQHLPSSPQAGHQLSKLTKINDVQQQHESKMSSECSSDETVIYVVGPKITTTATTSTTKALEASQCEHAKTSDEEEDNVKQLTKNIIEKSTVKKILPEIYSAVNSVSSQDSGINLSFNESDIRPMELGRTSSNSSSSSSSGGSSSAESYGIINNCRRVRSLSGTMKRRERDEKLPDDLSEDDDNDETIMMMMKEEIVPEVLSSDDEDETIDVIEKERKKLVAEKLSNSFGPQWQSPTKNIWKPVVEAIQEFDMIRDKDRVLICIPASAMGIGMATGQYSLALIHTLHQYRFYAKSKNIDFEIGAVTIDASDSYNPIEPMCYFKSLQIPYYYEECEEQALLIDSHQTIADCSQFSSVDYLTRTCNLCGNCGINTRKRLYSVAKRYGYNVLALGQHLDDFAEGFLSSLFYTGKLKTMKAHYYNKQHELRVVRPFVYVRERALKQFTLEKKLPILRNICVACEEAAELKTKRNKELMLQQEKNYPKLYSSMRTALRPLILARGSHNFASGHQRIRHKLKAKPSPSHLMIDALAVPKELGECESDAEQFI